MLKEVYQRMLMQPVDLSQKASDTIPFDGSARAARRKPYLHRHGLPCFRPRHHPEQQPDTTSSHRSHIVAASVEERTNQAPLFQMGCAGECVSANDGPRQAYLPGALSLTLRHLRPFLRRRASTLRPFFELMRARKPCLFLRLRRLG